MMSLLTSKGRVVIFLWISMWRSNQVNKLYIYPEEKALEKLFGDEFSAYKSEVGRWL
ncbi:hypothetical protein MNBD_GAMMA17-1878 [hydrothermal vent metagenome]|uniref:Uncharacterized protein n=1 Tax=hydrothermal vent metagenome TaxID=652676 RepID=A0A3B0ZNW2_9ZZZZ